MAKSRGKKIVTKKHFARIEKEQIQKRYITFGGIFVLLIVIGLIGYGIMEQKVLQPRQPVAIVGVDKITTREFQSRVRYQRYQLVQQYISAYQNMQVFATGDTNTQAFFQQNLRQIQFQLDPNTLGQQTLNDLIDERLIRQEAVRLGIEVTKEEVDARIQEAFGFVVGGEPPTPTPEPTIAPTSTLSPTQKALIKPTETPTMTITATPLVTVTTQVTSTSQVTSTATAVAEVTATPLPTPTEYTFESYQQDYLAFLKTMREQIDFTESDLHRLFESQIYREKVMEALTKDVLRQQDQVWARHILVEDEETANNVLTLLEEGQAFEDLAAEFSTDTSNKDLGGDLGWFSTGRMVPEFEKVAFSLGIGEISQPVNTQFGWHIIQVLGHENRPLSASEYEQFRQTQFEEWLTSQRQTAEVETFDYWTERVPAVPTIPPEIQQP